MAGVPHDGRLTRNVISADCRKSRSGNLYAMRRSFAVLGVSVLCLVAGIGASSNAVAPTARRNEPRLLPASAVTADVSAAIPSLRTPTPMFAAYTIVALR